MTANDQRRIHHQNSDIRELRAQLTRDRQTRGSSQWSSVRLAKVITAPSSGETFEVEFLDGDFTQAAAQTATYTDRGSTAWVANLAGAFIPAVDTRLHVVHWRDRWFADWCPSGEHGTVWEAPLFLNFGMAQQPTGNLTPWQSVGNIDPGPIELINYASGGTFGQFYKRATGLVFAPPVDTYTSAIITFTPFEAANQAQQDYDLYVVDRDEINNLPTAFGTPVAWSQSAVDWHALDQITLPDLSTQLNTAINDPGYSGTGICFVIEPTTVTAGAMPFTFVPPFPQVDLEYRTGGTPCRLTTVP